MNLSDPIYHNADKARDHLEALLWADGPVCPHCKVRDHASKIKGGPKGYKKVPRHKQQIVALVEPSSGRAKAFHVKRATTEKVRNILFTTVDRKSTLVSDESRLYQYTGKAYADHQTVNHRSGTYVNKK